MPIDPEDLPQRTLKPTIRDIVRTVGTEGAAADLPETAISGAVFATIREHYPEMTSEQIAAAIRAEVDAWVVRLDEADF